jgi:hypothetical protein
MYRTILVCSMAGLVVCVVAIARSGAAVVSREYALLVAKSAGRAGWLVVMSAPYSLCITARSKSQYCPSSPHKRFVLVALKCKVDYVIVQGPATSGELLAPAEPRLVRALRRSLVRRVPSHAALRPAQPISRRQA